MPQSLNLITIYCLNISEYLDNYLTLVRVSYFGDNNNKQTILRSLFNSDFLLRFHA
jgi:hypothetical protein